MMNPADVLDFWYAEPMRKYWFRSTREIDDKIRQQFETAWREASEGRFDHWNASAESSLALIILLDQMPLNMFRGQSESFLTERKAVQCTLYGIEQKYDQQLPVSRLNFFYMPLMHSELLEHQHLCVEKFEQAGLDENARFARHHRELIRRFGRFPHRNQILGRPSTAEELDYLASSEAFRG